MHARNKSTIQKNIVIISLINNYHKPKTFDLHEHFAIFCDSCAVKNAIIANVR